GGESLWSQLLMRAVTGSDAADHLTIQPLHYDLITWEEWTRLHPDTLVLNRDMSMAGRYQEASPKPYFEVQNELRFPVSPKPTISKALPLKTPIVVVQTPTSRRLYTLRYLANKARESQSASRTWTDAIGDDEIHFQIVGARDDVSVVVTSPTVDSSKLLVTHVFWFAWHAMNPDDSLVDLQSE
ncbi:MAG TPA: DUF3179 domain-containing (seleno)protein, partial [Phycisphaerales bacterium]|nr:DUF3179 domain-containing (seleno)protein [Phycisphaerales bacterium]